MTVVTRCPFLLTSNPVAPSLSLILSGAGSLQVRVMEVLVRSATARSCGGPVGTEREEKRILMGYWVGYGPITIRLPMTCMIVQAG